MKPIEIRTESRFLREGARALLLLPSESAPPRRLLTLLHGAQETPETLLENYDLSPAAARNGLAILLPDLGNSFYLDWGPGQNARSALLEELLPAARERSGVSSDREANLVGGISMGGFGALSLALGEPGCFASAFSLSGALDLKKAGQLFRICQFPPPGDLPAAAARPEARWDLLLSKNGAAPALYLAWGDRDWFREANRSFAETAKQRGLPVQAAESPGLHDWDYWKTALAPALAWAAGI